MPNVPTVEDADKIPPLTPGQEFKVVARGVFGFLKRAGHAVGRVVITRSDSGHTQLNYSGSMGGVSAAAISTYTYYPTSEQSASNVMSVWCTQMAWDAVTYMTKEFWPDLRKRSRKRSH
jgi:hypothetical protein